MPNPDPVPVIAEQIAKAIRAALEALCIDISDDQGAISSDCYLSNFDAAESAALKVLAHKEPSHDPS